MKIARSHLSASDTTRLSSFSPDGGEGIRRLALGFPLCVCCAILWQTPFPV